MQIFSPMLIELGSQCISSVLCVSRNSNSQFYEVEEGINFLYALNSTSSDIQTRAPVSDGEGRGQWAFLL